LNLLKKQDMTSTFIKVYQERLDAKRFYNESLTTSVRFQATSDTEYGTLWDVEVNKDFSYKLEQLKSSAIIECEYFRSKYFISTTPLGFNLHEIETKKVHLKYIEEFWIDNQEVINGILAFLVEDNNKDRQFTADDLARATRDNFNTAITWDEMQNMTDRIMEMLVEEQVVFAGQKQGQPCISGSPTTQKAIESNRYVFVQH
jgi:hypothetical protein